MTRLARTVLTVLLVGALSPSLQAAEPVTSELNPRLRQLLQEEMRAIATAMGTIHRAVVTGDHTGVGERARAIHDSFILEQSLAPEDRAALKAGVPEAFLDLDAGLHRQARDLADAADRKNTDAELRVFSAMTQTCVTCHHRFVNDRFPALTPGAATPGTGNGHGHP